MKIYKYVSESIIDLVLSEGTIKLKCSYPKDYNDPYELFLSADLSEASRDAVVSSCGLKCTTFLRVKVYHPRESLFMV